MMIIGCDLHTRYQQIAMLDMEMGELVELVVMVDPLMIHQELLLEVVVAPTLRSGARTSSAQLGVVISWSPCGAQKSRRVKKIPDRYKSWSARYLPCPFDSSQW